MHGPPTPLVVFLAFASKFFIQTASGRLRLDGRVFSLAVLLLIFVVALLLLLDLGCPSPCQITGVKNTQQRHAVKTVQQRFGTIRIEGWILKERQSRKFHGVMDNVTVLLCRQERCFKLPTHYQRDKRPLPENPAGPTFSTAHFASGALSIFLPRGEWEISLLTLHNGTQSLTPTDEKIIIQQPPVLH